MDQKRDDNIRVSASTGHAPNLANVRPAQLELFATSADDATAETLRPALHRPNTTRTLRRTWEKSS